SSSLLGQPLSLSAKGRSASQRAVPSALARVKIGGTTGGCRARNVAPAASIQLGSTSPRSGRLPSPGRADADGRAVPATPGSTQVRASANTADEAGRVRSLGTPPDMRLPPPGGGIGPGQAPSLSRIDTSFDVVVGDSQVGEAVAVEIPHCHGLRTDPGEVAD